jgi:hypothetical protein
MAEGDDPARTAWHAAGPGQLTGELLKVFMRAQARELFGDGLSTQDLSAHFFNCVTGQSNTGLSLEPLPPELQVQRGLRLFLRGVIPVHG